MQFIQLSDIALSMRPSNCCIVLYCQGDHWTQRRCKRPCCMCVACVQVLRFFIKNVLTAAHKRKLKKVAFPAVGCGGLSFPGDVVAKCMFDECDEFSSKNSSTSLSEVRFVIYDKDTATFNVSFWLLEIHSAVDMEICGHNLPVSLSVGDSAYTAAVLCYVMHFVHTSDRTGWVFRSTVTTRFKPEAYFY